ncbi:MAG: hypothetical protein LBC29_01960 [Propionibacteriaceae bacterium]|jgi:energy-coupling factor transport system substrate-specific component|nr:hypothetical protein [Propionibacteriaceae bacterium]
MTNKTSVFNLMGLLLIPVGVALDFALGSLALTLKLPIFLDSVGHILAGALGGPVIGAVTGFLGVMTNSMFAADAVVWAFQGAAIGLVVGLLAWTGLLKGWPKIILSTVIVIVLSVAMSAGISYVVYGGFDGYGISAVRAALVKAGMSLELAIVLTSFVAEFIDKVLSMAVPVVVIGLMSDRLLLKFPVGPALRDLELEPEVPSAAPSATTPGAGSGYGTYGDN